jgi:CelD/BcsL family acetyltransferase involved in cellulose biosynthesis
MRLAAELASSSPALEIVQFRALDPKSPSFAALRDGFRSANWIVKPFSDFGTWFEETDGLSFRDWLESRAPVVKKTFRLQPKLAKQHKLDYMFSDDGADIDELIADYGAIYRNAWQKSERFPAFIPNLIRLAASLGALRLCILRVDGVPAAAHLLIIWRRRVIGCKIAYDQRFSKLSVGNLVNMIMIDRLLEKDKPIEINYGRGDHEWKRLWLPRRRERWGLLAANPRTLQGAYHCARILASRVRIRRSQAMTAPPSAR